MPLETDQTELRFKLVVLDPRQVNGIAEFSPTGIDIVV